ncbi:hypothetical protein Tco_0728142 [Tanacetum coccineum]|uniref:Uncharacterized protein n=1 Tax=Tanacetum coccineum TaxID=301880 RepID=A0ABQ4YLC4_9ASTR
MLASSHYQNVSKQTTRRPYALSWKPCQGDSLNLPDHRIWRSDASFQLKSDSLPHAHAQTTKIISIKHQIQESWKAQLIKDTVHPHKPDIQDLPSQYQVYQGDMLAIFQDDAKLIAVDGWTGRNADIKDGVSVN